MKRTLAIFGIISKRLWPFRLKCALSVFGICLVQVAILLPKVGIDHAEQAYRYYVARGSYGLADFQIDRQPGQQFTASDINKIRNWPGVDSVFVAEASYPVSYEDGSKIGLFLGDPIEARRFAGFWIARGRYLRRGDTNRLVLSEAYAKKRGLSPGDTLTVECRGQTVTLQLVGLISHYGLAEGAEDDYGVGFAVRNETPLTGRVIFLQLQLKDKARLHETRDSLKVEYGDRYRIRVKPPTYVNPRLAEGFRWTGRAGRFAGMVLAAILVVAVTGIAFQVGMEEVLLMRVWVSLGLSRSYSYLVLAVETLVEALLAGLLTLAGLRSLQYAIDAAYGLELPAAVDYDISYLWAWWSASSLCMWACLFSGRCIGTVYASGRLLRSPYSESSLAKRSLWAVIGGGAIWGAIYVIGLLGEGLSVDAILWLCAFLLIVGIPCLSAGVSHVACVVVVWISRVSRLCVVVDRLRLTSSLILQGGLTLGTAFATSALMFTAIGLLRTSVQTITNAQELHGRDLLFVWAERGTGEMLYSDLQECEDIAAIHKVTAADAMLDGGPQVRVAGFEAPALVLPVFSVHDRGHPSRDAVRQGKGCLVTASLAADQNIHIGDRLRILADRGQLSTPVVGLLPPTLSIAQIVLHRDIVAQYFHLDGPEYFLVALRPGIKKSVFWDRFRASATGGYTFKSFHLLNRGKEVAPYLRAAELGLAIAAAALLLIGMLAASQNALLQIALQRNLILYQGLGAPRMRVCGEAFFAVFILLLGGLTGGRVLGGLLAWAVSTKLGEQMLIRPAYGGFSHMNWMYLAAISALIAGGAAAVTVFRQDVSAERGF